MQHAGHHMEQGKETIFSVVWFIIHYIEWIVLILFIYINIYIYIVITDLDTADVMAVFVKYYQKRVK